MSELKAREFWIDKQIDELRNNLTVVFVYKDGIPQQENGQAWHHVIEYSAYQDMQAKLEKAISALEIANQYFTDRGGLGFKGGFVEEKVSKTLKEIKG